MTPPNNPPAEVSVPNEGELLACPFCGGEAELTGFRAPEFWVRCPKIGCKASTEGFGSKERAIAAWNTRTPAPEAAPAGWRLVPVEPNEAMLVAGCRIPGVSIETGKRMWSAMLSASPTPDTGGTTLDAMRGEVERLRAALEEIDYQANCYIEHGVDIGASIWRDGLEDIKRRCAAALAEEGGK